MKKAVSLLCGLLMVFTVLFFPVLPVSAAESADGVTALPDGNRGESYTADLKSAGDKSSYRYKLANGLLIYGLELSEDGVLSGTPESYCEFKFDVEIYDGGSNPIETKTYSLRIGGAPEYGFLCTVKYEETQVNYNDKNEPAAPVKKTYITENFHDAEGKPVMTKQYAEDGQVSQLEMTYRGEKTETLYYYSFENGHITQKEDDTHTLNDDGKIVHEIGSFMYYYSWGISAGQAERSYTYTGENEYTEIIIRRTLQDDGTYKTNFYDVADIVEDGKNYGFHEYCYEDETKTKQISESIHTESETEYVRESWNLNYSTYTLDKRVTSNDGIRVTSTSQNYNYTDKNDRNTYTEVTNNISVSYRNDIDFDENTSFYSSYAVDKDNTQGVLGLNEQFNTENKNDDYTTTFKSQYIQNGHIDRERTSVELYTYTFFNDLWLDYLQSENFLSGATGIADASAVDLTVKGDIEFSATLSLKVRNLIVPRGSSLTVPDGATLTVLGDVIVDGKTVASGVTYTDAVAFDADADVRTVTLSGGTAEGHDDNEVAVTKGTVLTLTADAAPEGQAFIGWFDGTAVISRDSTYQYTVDENARVSAVFAARELSVNVGLIIAIAAGALILGAALAFVTIKFILPKAAPAKAEAEVKAKE